MSPASKYQRGTSTGEHSCVAVDSSFVTRNENLGSEEAMLTFELPAYWEWEQGLVSLYGEYRSHMRSG